MISLETSSTKRKQFVKYINLYYIKYIIIKVLPNYELAKYIENYALAYKEQMKSLISTILIKIKKIIWMEIHLLKF